jgi:hypothetical protein
VDRARLTCEQHPSQTAFPQVSPKREDLTGSDLGFYCLQVIFMCPVYPGFLAVLDPCLLGGRMLGQR